MIRIIESPFRNFILGGLLGSVIVAFGFTMRQAHAQASEPEQQQPSVECPTIESNGKKYPITQEGWEFAQKAIRQQHETIERLSAELAEAKANPAVQLLAQSGHVMNEEQCRAWVGILNVPRDLAQAQIANVSTVLYESGRASVNVSLLPLPGAPRVAISPNSELQPRWVVPGRIQPQMIGETRKAIYYYFDSASSQWQGPFAPQRVVQ